MAWTQEQKADIVKRYLDADPTAATSTEIVKQIADELKQSPNAVRMILMQEKNADGVSVYIKKDDAAATSSTGGGAKADGDKAAKTPRVSKETSIKALKDAIVEKGVALDDDILDKLTGKAAVYLLSVLKA